MRFIPVIDLLGGVVVRGVGGHRDEYRPLVSSLTPSAEPGAIARALQQNFPVHRVYVADLDAITRGERDVESWRAIAAADLSLTLDAGLQTAAEAADLFEFVKGKFVRLELVIGLESWRRLSDLCELNAAGWLADRAVFSLDLKSGVPLTQDPDWKTASPLEIMAEVIRCGIRRAIVLDLADVGSGQGTSTLPLIRQLHEQFPDLEIIAGGGVRGPADLRQLSAAGASAALVASALHDGRLTATDIRNCKSP